jgi:hypothetical protein
MAVKVKSRFSSHNMLFRLSNALRTVGWFAAMITLGASIPNFFRKYEYFSSNQWTSPMALSYAVGDVVGIWTVGLGFAACAFVLSVMLYTGLSMLAHKRSQLELLQRLVRERSEKLSPEQAVILIETL